eukprot:8998599-Lingulodinium_polyedra.AAC.1
MDEPLGKDGAQAIMDKFKSIQRRDLEHQGITIYKGLKTDAEKRQFGFKIGLDKEGSFCNAMEKHGLSHTEEMRAEEGKL